MTDAPYQRIFDTARAHLPGALDGGMHLELFNTLREFTSRSNIWQDEIPVRMASNRNDYEITAISPSAYINRLMWLEGERSTGRGVAVTATMKEVGHTTATLHIPGSHNGGSIYHAHVALIIADPTGPTGLPRIPDWIIDGFYDTILSGLLERMMIQPAKPYSNIQGASYHGRRFRQGMNAARVTAQHGDTYRGQAWRFPGAFRTRSQLF